MTIVGVGGICNGQDTQAMLNAGAKALQIYTYYIFKST